MQFVLFLCVYIFSEYLSVAIHVTFTLLPSRGNMCYNIPTCVHTIRGKGYVKLTRSEGPKHGAKPWFGFCIFVISIATVLTQQLLLRQGGNGSLPCSFVLSFIQAYVLLISPFLIATKLGLN